MSAFPGMTPAAMWDLPQVEWWLIATAADEWADRQRQRAREVTRGR